MQDAPHYQTATYALSPMASLIASIIKFPPENKPNSYETLACTEEDREKIYEIITTLGDNGKLYLLTKRSHLKGLGAQITHVHALKFLSTIVTNPRLRACLPEIFKDYFKRTNFMEGLSPSLSRESEQGKLDEFIDGFAKEINIPREQLRPFFQNRDWEGLVRFFFEDAP